MEDRTQELVARTPAMVHAVDREGRIVAVSDDWLAHMGFSRPEVVGRPAADFLAEDSRRHHVEVVWPELHRTGACRDVACQLVKRDGEVFDALLSEVAERDPRGGIAGAVAVVTDVTERRRIQQQLAHARKMEAVGRLAGSVAHDFSTIMSAIGGYAGLLQLEMRPDDPHRPEVDEIAAAAGRATQLTRGLLAFSRKKVLHRQRTDLNAVVSGGASMLRRLLSEDLSLETRLSDGPLPVFADGAQVQQVLLHLAGFAGNRMATGGRVVVSTVRADLDPASAEHIDDGMPGHYAVLTLTDTGPALDGRARDRLFEPFAGAGPGGGEEGLDLSVAHGIVRQHGGFIGVDSAPGHGTSFRIYLPLLETPAREASPEPLRPAQPRSDGVVETILVADDEPRARQEVESFLRAAGYDVVPAEDGRDAVAKFRARPDDIHLVLLDVIMPRMSGRAAWEQIRLIRPGVKVLFTSGHGVGIARDRGVAEDGAGHRVAPRDLTALGRKIRTLLDGA